MHSGRERQTIMEEKKRERDEGKLSITVQQSLHTVWLIWWMSAAREKLKTPTKKVEKGIFGFIVIACFDLSASACAETKRRAHTHTPRHAPRRLRDSFLLEDEQTQINPSPPVTQTHHGLVMFDNIRWLLFASTGSHLRNKPQHTKPWTLLHVVAAVIVFIYRNKRFLFVPSNQHEIAC